MRPAFKVAVPEREESPGEVSEYQAKSDRLTGVACMVGLPEPASHVRRKSRIANSVASGVSLIW
jgi:hypothetical protein